MDRRTATLLTAFLAAAVGSVLRSAPAVKAGETFAQQPAAFAQFPSGGSAAQIPARFVDNLIFLPVHVNQSQPCLFELDSTAAASLIDPGRAAELGIADLQMPLLNLSGVDISLATLPEAVKKDFGALVGRPYEGTLGNDVFAGTVIEVNYARQTVQIYNPAVFQYSGHGKSVHMNLTGGVPVVHARFNVAGGKALEGDFAVNTARNASFVISEKFAQAHRLIPSHMKTIPITEPEPGIGEGAVLGRMREFQIGPFSIAQSIAVFSRGNSAADGDARLAGEIGGGVLRRFIVTFDYPHQQIIFDSSSEYRADEFENMSGISIVAGGPGLKRFEVTQVRRGTPGADAGIQKGDVIAGINDEAAADLSLADIHKLFRQPASKYKLLIQRDTQTLTVNIQMRHLL